MGPIISSNPFGDKHQARQLGEAMEIKLRILDLGKQRVRFK